VPCAAGGLGKLPEEFRKVIGHGFAQRVVIDRTKRTAEIALARLAAA
jgi:hypothetical protein